MVARLLRRQSILFLTSLCLLGLSKFGVAQKGNDAQLLPQEEEALYQTVPDITVRTIDGVTLPLSTLWQQRPLLLTFVFAHCAGVCYPYLQSLRDAVRKVGGLGSAYEVVVLSFAPEDTLADLRLMVEILELSAAERAHWHFGVGKPEEIQRLERTVRFWHRRIQGTNQYDHPAMLAGIREGRVVRLLVGATVVPVRLHEVIRELQGELVLSYPLPDPKVPFRCFQYDPKTGRWRLDWGMLVLLTPPLLTVVLVAGLFCCKPVRRVPSMSSQTPSR